MMKPLALCLLSVGLTGCNAVSNTAGALGLGNATPFRTTLERDGVRYRARVAADPEDKREMSIFVTPVATNPEAAVSTASFAANRYCILVYGGSDKVWTLGPDTPVEQLPIEDDTATLRGRCTQR